ALRVHPRAIVWIPSGASIRGSDASDVGFALALCLLSSPGGSLERICRDDLFIEEMPARAIWTSAYGIDAREVTHAAYQRCVQASVCTPPRVASPDARLALPDHPVSGVTALEAETYCSFVGGRLPTEAEWERAARGDSRPPHRFPWGRAYSERLANHGQIGERPDGIDGYRYAAPVGSFPDGASPFGVLDMAGNVWEWTADRFERGGYATGPSVDPRGADSSNGRVVRGGSWRSSPITLRVSHRVPVPETLSAPDLGFRCAHDARR
ncbi:MAG: SUMF1/EgtB/PvdO family nonheme iron enzyme, partial [Polyangiaceae bacterium]|nr:SUMF1/EgtB/PvdO family nonheme iron enzyme [Polyangiaceae bacterium]